MWIQTSKNILALFEIYSYLEKEGVRVSMGPKTPKSNFFLISQNTVVCNVVNGQLSRIFYPPADKLSKYHIEIIKQIFIKYKVPFEENDYGLHVRKKEDK